MARLSPAKVLLFGAVWVVLAAPRWDAWVAGSLAVAVAVLLHLGLGRAPAHRVRILGIPAFAAFFLTQSVRGGVDVSRRALSPSLPISPSFLRYRSGLPEGPALVLFVNVVSLLPGTFSADLRGREVLVHLLTSERGAESRLNELETVIARLFGFSDRSEGGTR